MQNCLAEAAQLASKSEKPGYLLLRKFNAIATAELPPILEPHAPSRKKTLRDIWGHLGTFGDICPTFAPNREDLGPVEDVSGRPLCRIHTHAKDGTNSQNYRAGFDGSKILKLSLSSGNFLETQKQPDGPLPSRQRMLYCNIVGHFRPFLDISRRSKQTLPQFDTQAQTLP